jgi:hypothetical protein
MTGQFANSFRIWAVASIGLLLAMALVRPAYAEAQAAQPRLDVTITAVHLGGNSIDVRWPGQSQAVPLAVPDVASWAKARLAEPGDTAKIAVDKASAPTKLTAIEEIDRPVPVDQRVWTFGIMAILLLGVTAAVTGGKPLQFVVGKDNRYSNSQVQLALWFGAVAIVYGAAVWLRFEWLGGDFIGGVGLTTNLVALTGLSALSFGGAKVITAQKVADAPAANAAAAAVATAAGAAPPPAIVKTTSGAGPNILTDLFQNDAGQADLGDFQMILISVVAVGMFVISSFHFLGSLQITSPVTLPDVDTTLLASFGISQGAYLVKKVALPLGQG